MATTKLFPSNIEIAQIFAFKFHFLSVVLNTQKLEFFPFLDNFFKQAKNSYFFYMACL